MGIGFVCRSMHGFHENFFFFFFLPYRENRYLLFLTENYAALDILKHYLSDVSLANQTTEHQDMEPFILFGSSFPKDKEYTQVSS